MEDDPNGFDRSDGASASECDQRAILALLMDPATYGESEDVKRVDTHAAQVFLCGDHAYKIKRPVKYDYLDFSTLDLRHQMLTREFELNHPNAPEIYEDVVSINRDARGRLSVGGAGTPVEWVLRMSRFDQEAEFSRIAERGELTDALADHLGQSIAAYHFNSEPRDSDGAELIAEIIEELRLAFETMEEELERDRIAAYLDGCNLAFERVADVLSTRSGSGHVRRCHGDLHLCNIVLIDGRPVAFDALEFDEILGTCDVLYDLAFLVMDLNHKGLSRAANMVLNGYLYAERGMEDPGIEAFPLFLAIRGGIRAMVDIQTDRACDTPGQKTAGARRYLDEAIRALAPPAPRLIAVGGRSGSGKTSVSRQIAPLFGAAPGAVHLRSDLERKAIFCVDPLTHLPPESYTPTVNRHVHERLRIRADTILRTGHSVLLDAVFTTRRERTALSDLAERLGVEFTGIWLQTDADHLIPRVAARRGDASDADETVVRQQLRTHTGPMDWYQVDASGSAEETLAHVCAVLGFDVPE
ncbi:AAA family ATPase [Amaricoccus macauensis]|uniref:bifunctional aminoglycoside phosphotransferase/ATP-binding protein n=1 Tax=Amaricoccus macauensis TaxID=57001 RepID=UPI003C7ADCFA